MTHQTPSRHNHYPLGTDEYVKATVTLDAADLPDPTAAALDQAVAISIDTGTTWLPATWQGVDVYDDSSKTHTRKARTTDTVVFATPATGPVLVKITDTAEAPIIIAGYYTAA